MTPICASQPPDTRDSLIEAALTCFARYGYDATSIRLVASMAGKNSSLIAYYFGNKEGLYREVIRHLLARFGSRPAQGGPAAGPAGAEADPPRARLRAQVLRILVEVDAHFHSPDPLRDAAVRLWLSELQSPKPEVRDLLRERLEPSVREIRACIREIRPDLSPADVDLLGITFQGSCIGHALTSEINRLVWTSLDPHLTIEAMADRLTGFAYHGLKQA